MERTVLALDSIRYRARGDSELVALARQGNSAAFDAFVDRHQPRVYAFLLTILVSEEEAGQALRETFVSAHRELKTSDPSSSPRAWLFRHAVRAAFGRIHARHADPVRSASGERTA